MVRQQIIKLLTDILVALRRSRVAHENYVDRKQRALFGRFSSNVDDQLYPTSCPSRATGSMSTSRTTRQWI